MSPFYKRSFGLPFPKVMFVPTQIFQGSALIEERYNQVAFERLRFEIYQNYAELEVFKDANVFGQYFNIPFQHFEGFRNDNVRNSDAFIKVEIENGQLVASLCLDNVSQLDLSHTMVSDVSKLNGIDILNLYDTYVDDISSLTKVKELNITNTEVRQDIKTLRKMLPNTRIIYKKYNYEDNNSDDEEYLSNL